MSLRTLAQPFLFLTFCFLCTSLHAQPIPKLKVQKNSRTTSQFHEPVASQKTSSQKVSLKEMQKKSSLQVLVYPLSSGFYSERGEDQEQKLRRPENFALGLRYGRFSSYVESSQFEEITGQGNYTVERKRKSFLLWSNYDLAEFENLVYLPVGLGLGVYNETSITKLPGLQDRRGGDYQWNAGLSAALELRYRFVSFKTEGQLLFANNQSPNPTWAAFARLGIILF